MGQLVRTSRILDANGRPFYTPVPRKSVRASYDAAQTTSENVRHWNWADDYSADSANSLGVRTKLRRRARYEVANNGWARSMVETLAHEVIGSGPRLQVREGGTPAACDWIEYNFATWCQAIHLGRKFRTMRKAKAQDGEAFGLFFNNGRLRREQLDLRVIETDQVTTPDLGWSDDQIDGIDLDENGEPLAYHVLKQHPGEFSWGTLNPTEEIKPAPRAEEMIHVFRRDRPGQHRGIPELTPALPLFSRLRRFTLAVLSTAENIADITIALKTKQPDSTDMNYGPSGTSGVEPSSYEVFDTFDLERNLVTVLPDGTEPWQPDTKQPATTHADYVRVTLAEAFAAVCMPYSVGAFDSSQENFASGKLTRQGFKRAVQVERALDWDPEVLRVFWEWWREAKFFIPNEIRSQLASSDRWRLSVYWDGIDDIDPEKAAKARAVELETGQTSYPRLFADKGSDWENEQTQQAKALGLTIEEYRKRLTDKLFGSKQAESPAD